VLNVRPTLPDWAHSARPKMLSTSAAADQARAMVRTTAKANKHATTEQLADLKLREECVAIMLRAEANRPASKKPSRLVSLLEFVKRKTSSRILSVKRALHTHSGLR
jgi:hypothetical protein